MSRKKIYVFSLAGFFLMWGIFGFVAAGPRPAPAGQATAPAVESTPVLPGTTETAAIPVTGEPERVWPEILGFYGLIGLAALLLILALLSFANRSTALYVDHKHPSSEDRQKREIR